MRPPSTVGNLSTDCLKPVAAHGLMNGRERLGEIVQRTFLSEQPSVDGPEGSASAKGGRRGVSPGGFQTVSA